MRSLLLAPVLIIAIATSVNGQAFNPALSSTGFAELSISKATLPGKQIRLYDTYALHPDCTQSEIADLQIIEPPQHGQANIIDDLLYPAYPSSNARAACNSKRVPGKETFYTPAPNYIGHDRVVLQLASKDGLMRRITVEIDVRQ